MGFQALTLEQLQTVEGVAKLNDVLYEISNMGSRVLLQYGLDASTSADAYAAFMDGVVGTSTIGVRMPAGGSIVRHSCLMNVTTATTGDVTSEVRINNTNQASLEVEFDSADGTGVASDDAQVERHKVSFSRGDLLQVHLNLTGTMTWEDVIGTLELIFDE